jgi:hypothetical protein
VTAEVTGPAHRQRGTIGLFWQRYKKIALDLSFDELMAIAEWSTVSEGFACWRF